MKIFPNMKNLAALQLVSVCAFGVRLNLVAMPTAEELAEVKPLVAELIKPDMDAMRAGKKSKSAAAKASLSLASQAETPAAKLLLTRNAFQLYMKGGDYDAADAALDAMLKAVPDYPADELQELLEKALYPVPSKKAPQIRARVVALKQKAAAATQLKKVLSLLEKTPDDPALNLRLGTVYALQNDWKRAAPAFAKGSDAALAKAANAELDLEISPAKAADLYWAVELPKKDAQIQASLRAHAVDLYKLSLPSLTGLTKVQAERRIKDQEVANSAGENLSSVRWTPSARNNPYVTKGLVSMWDGEWNQGIGKSVKKTSSWKDLVGSCDCTPVGTPTFSGKATVLDGASYWKFDASAELERVLSSTEFTVEIAFRFDSENIVANEGLIGIGARGSRAVWVWGFGAGQPKPGSLVVDFQLKGGTPVRVGRSEEVLLGDVCTMSLVLANSNLEVFTANSSTKGRPGANKIYGPNFIGNLDSFSAMRGAIYSVRIYDRALTPGEVQKNRSIDLRRFGK